MNDLGARFFTVEDVRDFLDRQDVVSKFRAYRDVYESTFVNEKTGHTIYFGSRMSSSLRHLVSGKIRYAISGSFTARLRRRRTPPFHSFQP